MSVPLSSWERDLFTWVLPEERSPYIPYRECVLGWVVASRGMRGDGHIVLTPRGNAADLDMPLPQVFAYGVVETVDGIIAVSIRELVTEQLDCDLSLLSGESLPGRGKEIRRWSYSRWNPGHPCPICSGQVREVRLVTPRGVAGVLAVCSRDERLWVFDSVRGIALPVPLTSFYAELMRVQGIRDPLIALAPHRFFSALESYNDDAMIGAFAQYNKLRPKIAAGDLLPARTGPSRRPSLVRLIRSLVGKSPSSQNTP